MLVQVFVAEFHQRPPVSVSAGSVVEGMSVGVAECAGVTLAAVLPRTEGPTFKKPPVWNKPFDDIGPPETPPMLVRLTVEPVSDQRTAAPFEPPTVIVPALLSVMAVGEPDPNETIVGCAIAAPERQANKAAADNVDRDRTETNIVNLNWNAACGNTRTRACSTTRDQHESIGIIIGLFVNTVCRNNC